MLFSKSMEMSVHLVLGLLLWTSTGGSSSQQIFIQTDHNLHLDVPEGHIEYIIFFWKINTSNNIITLSGNNLIPNPEYKDRVEFFPQNLSLILKNVQLRDTGTYSAVVSGTEGDKTLHFEVIVQDPVSPVELSLSSVSNSSESCNFTVSCTTELYSISRSFTCDTHSCEEPRPQTPGHAPSGHAPSLHLYLSDQSIICNHSNHVSWTTDTRNYHQMCFSQTGPEEVLGLSVCTLKTLVYCVGLLLMLSALITAHVLEHRSKQD